MIKHWDTIATSVVDLAKLAYSELEWEVEGGGNFEQFNFVKTDIDDDNQKKW